MSFQLERSIFREYDIRGIAGRDITEDFALCLGRAYAQMIRSKHPVSQPLTLSIGRDCRLTSDAYAHSVITGLVQSGINVIVLPIVPSPLTYFSVFHLDLDGSIMITGSHNSADYNGFKISIGKDTIHGSQITELYHLMAKIRDGGWEASKVTGTKVEYNIIPPYLDYLIANWNAPQASGRKLKVVIDSGNGTASGIAPALFSRLGVEVVPLFCELDGHFPNHHPDPTVPENLKQLVNAVREEKADFGIAFDGDADRLGVVDENGTILFGDELMILFARNVIQNNPGSTIISEVKSSYKLYNDIAEKGGIPVMWKTGHSLIKSKMKETGALLAGEMSGHLFFADRYFGYDDAIYASMRLLEIVVTQDQPFSSLLSDLPKSVSTPEIRVECEESKKFELVEETKRNLVSSLTSNETIIEIDGIRVNFGDGWGLVRASNTQPVLVLRFEAQTRERLEEIQTRVQNHLRDAARTLHHFPILCS